MTAALTPGAVPSSTAGQLGGSRPVAVVVPAPRPAGELTAGAAEDTTLRVASAAARALDQARPEYADVVGWLSRHLAALDRVVYPAAARQLPHARPVIHAQRARGRELERVLRGLHAHLNGDGSAPLRELPRLHSQLQQTLREHSQGERRLHEQLRRTLPAQDWERLTVRYRATLAHGPTRPHPFNPHAGLAGRLAYRAAAAVDRLLDVLESRPVHPLPPQPEPGAAAPGPTTR